MNNRKNSLTALLITTLLMICLLAAGGFFVLPAIQIRMMDQAPAEDRQKREGEAEDFGTWLGLDTVRTILSPEDPARSAAETSSNTDAKDSVLTAAGSSPRTGTEDSAKDISEKADSDQVKSQTTESETSKSGTNESETTKKAGKSTETKKAEKTEKAETTEKAEKTEKAETTEKADKTEKTKKTEEAEKAKTTEKTKTTEKAKEDETTKEAETTGNTKKDETPKESDSAKKDPQDSMTKLQKKYVQAWEDFHGRAFPLNAPLHNYNWKYLQYDEMGRLHYDGDRHYSIRHGIDVSEFQGRIDWEKVRKSGIDFVFVRAGHRMFESGDLMKDSRAVKNLTRAKKAGLEVGVYVFSQAVTEEEAREEAQLCLDVIKESGVEVTLPIVFDPEIQIEYYARINFIDGEQFTDNTLAFCKAIKKAGYTPAVYANCSTETDILDMSRLDGQAAIWYADYNSIPESPYQFTFWQYSNTGRVEGIPETETDLNVWFVEKQ